MDDNLQLTEPLINDWLQHIREVNNEQEDIIKTGRKFFIPFMAIPMPVVKTVFVVCDYLTFGPRTKYLALYIYERFMCNQFWEIFHENEDRPNSSEYSDSCDKLTNVSLIRLMSCIQLASKMDSHLMSLGISQVISVLQLLEEGHEYTRSAVFLSEMKVFQLIDFKIPLVTPVDCIEVLLAALNLAKMEKLYNASISVLDMTYLQHQQLYSQLQVLSHNSIARSKEDKINFMKIESDILFLSSSIIMCTMEIFHVKETVRDSIADRLEDLAGIDKNDFVTLGKMIFTMIDPANANEKKFPVKLNQVNDMTTFEEQFSAFSKFGDAKSDGTRLNLSQSDKWMKQAKVFDKKITTTDTAICFNKFKQKSLDLESYQKYIDELAKYKGVDPKIIRDKLIQCGAPGLTFATQPVETEIVRNLTDTTKYTGTHRERFDSSGRGKGKAGRMSEAPDDGYVQGYKHKDTYDKTHGAPS